MSATLNFPRGLVVDNSGNLLLADSRNQRIRRIDLRSGVITTIAGSGRPGFSGDGGLAIAASLFFPLAIGMDTAGNLVIADSGNHRIRRVDMATGGITTLAGNGKQGFSGDGGPASSASLHSPAGVAVDPEGNVFIADSGNHKIRKIDARTGVIITVAGNGEAGFAGDAGPAVAARVSFPESLVLDLAGNLQFADTVNHRIRKIDALTGIITTVADGNSLRLPSGLAVDGAGNLFISNTADFKILKIDAKTRVLFEGSYARVVWGEADYDVSPDGQRFLMIKGETQSQSTELYLIVNWFVELRRLLQNQN